jgi:predicted branched-subunit amino acid permease
MKDFKKGIFDGLPIGIGYLSVAFAFGIFAVSAGLSSLEALFISMTNVTSAGQLAAVPIIASGGLMSELVSCQLIINLRYALMSVTLSQKFDKSIKLFDRFILAFVNTDEVFAVASLKEQGVNKPYMYGLIIPPYLGWSLGTIIGALAGNVLPAIVTSALGIAIYGMFIAIVTPVARKSRPVLICVLISASLSCIFKLSSLLNTIPNGFVIIICAVVSAFLCAALYPLDIKEETANE